MKSRLKILIVIISFIAACSESYVINMDKETNYPDGRDLYSSKCNACHRLYNPNKYTASEWDSLLIPMEKKAKIEKEHRDKIYHWILEIKADNAKAEPDNY